MIQAKRIKIISPRTASAGKYVVYWMQAAQRAEYNHALEYAIEQANKSAIPLVVLFCLVCNYPEANERHYRFMLEGLRETQKSLEARGIQMVIVQEAPDVAVPRFAKQAKIVVVDAGHLRIQRKWRKNVAARINCPLIEIETNLIVPVEVASPKQEYSAGTFRPKIGRQLDGYLVKWAV
jgi:deoxyribodipyrimidine photo-lyase